jgi:hemerythrin-like domain-containing protein
MEATTILMDEHRVIERVLNSLEAGAQMLQEEYTARPGFFIEATEFIKGFADGCHHQKEEGVLFIRMSEYGVPVQGGPIGVMLAEHEQGRVFTRNLREAAERLEAGDLSARDEVIRNSLGYAALLRQHIYKEDNILFPMADKVIPFPQQAQVSDDFERVEHEETGEGVHEKYLALAQRLADEIKAQTR